MKARSPSGAFFPSFSIDGESADRVKPDQAILSLEAVNDGVTPAAASIENGKVANEIVVAVEKLGVDAGDIQAEDLRVEPLFRQRGAPGNGEGADRVFIGYRASTMYRIRMRDIERAPAIARQMVEGGGGGYRGLTFLASDREARFESLRAKAVANAMERAKVYADSASLKLGDIVGIAPEDSYSGHSEKDLPGRGDEAAEAGLSVPAAPNAETLIARVRVTWELPSKYASTPGADTDTK